MKVDYAKYRNPIILGTHTIKRKGKTRKLVVCDTITATTKLNKMQHTEISLLLKQLGYEHYYNENRLLRLKKGE